MYMQPTLSTSEVQSDGRQSSESNGLRTISCGNYTYTIMASDLQREQDAFQTGEGVR